MNRYLQIFLVFARRVHRLVAPSSYHPNLKLSVYGANVGGFMGVVSVLLSLSMNSNPAPGICTGIFSMSTLIYTACVSRTLYARDEEAQAYRRRREARQGREA